MNSLKCSLTYSNLAKAFAGESQAHMRYGLMANVARRADLKALEKIIKQLAENEYHHARMFYAAIQSADPKTIESIEICSGYPFKEKWDISDNLLHAAKNEAEEGQTIYPGFAQTARSEGFEEIAELWECIAGVENQHQAILEDLHIQMITNSLYIKKIPVEWVCGDCGYTATSDKAWQICPLCKAKQGEVLLHLSKPEVKDRGEYDAKI